LKSNWFYKNKYYIGIAISVAIIGIILYKTKGKKESKTIVVEGNDIQTDGSLIYSLPKTKFDNYSIVIVFGGINYANPKWMLTETPKSLLSKAIFVYAPYTMSYDALLPKLNEFIAKNKILVKDTSVIGFSAGGLNVQKANRKTFKFIGLIDPSTRSEYVNLPFTNNVKMVYNDANWGSLPKIKEALPKLAQSIKNVGGDSEKVSLAHAKIPAYFFAKFQNLIA